MADTAVIEFEYKKSTPGTIVYSEVTEPGKPPIIGTLYIKKYWAEGEKGKEARKVQVTLKKV